MRRKFISKGVILACMVAMAATGCSKNTSKEAESAVETSVDSTETVEGETIDADTWYKEEMKRPVENEDGSVTMYGNIITIPEENVYLVDTASGIYTVQLTEDTKTDGTFFSTGMNVEFTSNSGAATLTDPGMISDVIEFKLDEDYADETDTYVTDIARVMPETDRTNAELVVYYGLVEEVTPGNELIVITHDGEKQVFDPEMKFRTGDFVIIRCDGNETRTIPAIIVSVDSVDAMETPMVDDIMAELNAEGIEVRTEDPALEESASPDELESVEEITGEAASEEETTGETESAEESVSKEVVEEIEKN
jgi:hypothetical protein